MLPLEVARQVIEHLDLPTLWALSQTSKFWRTAICEEEFRAGLQQVCPWFTVQNSSRDTWKQCVLEYLRRQKAGCEFASSIKLVDAEEFEVSPVLDITQCDYLDGNQLEKDPIYTSKHGIRVNLSGIELSEDDELDERSVVLSLPHIVVVAVGSPHSDTEIMCKVLVKLKDSPGLDPDFHDLVPLSSLPYFYSDGNYILACVTESCGSNNTRSQLWYIGKEGIRVIVLSDNNFHSIVCFDGLIHFFEDEYYYSVQFGFDNIGPIVKRVDTTNLITAWSNFRIESWDIRYCVVLDINGNMFVLDVSRGMIVPAERRGSVFTVMKSSREEN